MRPQAHVIASRSDSDTVYTSAQAFHCLSSCLERGKAVLSFARVPARSTGARLMRPEQGRAEHEAHLVCALTKACSYCLCRNCQQSPRARSRGARRLHGSPNVARRLFLNRCRPGRCAIFSSHANYSTTLSRPSPRCNYAPPTFGDCLVTRSSRTSRLSRSGPSPRGLVRLLSQRRWWKRSECSSSHIA